MTVDELYGHIWLSFFLILNQVFSCFCCLAECCSDVLLRSSKKCFVTRLESRSLLLRSLHRKITTGRVLFTPHRCWSTSLLSSSSSSESLTPELWTGWMGTICSRTVRTRSPLQLCKQGLPSRTGPPVETIWTSSSNEKRVCIPGEPQSQASQSTCWAKLTLLKLNLNPARTSRGKFRYFLKSA